MCNVHVKLGPPANQAELLAWKKRFDCSLPEDMEQLYAVNNGATLTWQYAYNSKL